MIAFACPGCGKQLQVKDELAGKKARCPGCGKVSEAPAMRRQEVEPQTLPPGVQEDADISGQETMGGGAKKEAPGQPADLTAFLAPSRAPDELGRLGPFRVLQVLGVGGMGVVYKAEDPQLKRPVALKAMLPSLGASEEARKRFLREAQAAAAIVHDHIVPILQVGEDCGTPFMAMQFLEGEPLDERVKREPRLTVAEAVRIGREVAEGLAAAHEKGLVHRDIKPANIWLEGKKGRVKILDFGLARAAAGDDLHLTKSGTIIGTPAYMAPEQGRSNKVDCRCDLFSLGAVLYRVLTGELPFKGHDTMSVLMALAADTPVPLRQLNADVPEPLSALVMRLLAKEPQQRPVSAQLVADALEEIEKGQHPPPTRPPPTAPQRAAEDKTRTDTAAPELSRPARKWPPLSWLIGGGALGLGVLVGLLLLLLRDDPASRERQRPEDGTTPKQINPALPTFTNDLGMKFVLIPSGKFTMGSPRSEIAHFIDLPLAWPPADFFKAEGPEHEVEITQRFWMGTTEVTVGQFRQFVTESKYPIDDAWLKPGWEQSEQHPVVNVTWPNALAFCEWLSKKEDRTYCLPTEAEWEYCCRAGREKTRYCFSNEDADLDKYAWHASNSASKTHPVGQLDPNAWGLYDMHGNAWEHCQDCYDADYYQHSPKQNPQGEGGLHRTRRGGGWQSAPAHCRCAFRDHDAPEARSNQLGFRVVAQVAAGDR
jgi:formylglycine-generating enzyme required for sulfatase activity